MNQVQLNNETPSHNEQHLAPAKRKSKPRKWREIENLKAQLSLAKELRDIDPSYSFSASELM